jgi:hypothetical protein
MTPTIIFLIVNDTNNVTNTIIFFIFFNDTNDITNIISILKIFNDTKKKHSYRQIGKACYFSLLSKDKHLSSRLFALFIALIFENYEQCFFYIYNKKYNLNSYFFNDTFF